MDCENLSFTYNTRLCMRVISDDCTWLAKRILAWLVLVFGCRLVSSMSCRQRTGYEEPLSHQERPSKAPKFSWVIPELLAAHGRPTKPGHIKYLCQNGITRLVTLTENKPTVLHRYPGASGGKQVQMCSTLSSKFRIKGVSLDGSESKLKREEEVRRSKEIHTFFGLMLKVIVNVKNPELMQISNFERELNSCTGTQLKTMIRPMVCGRSGRPTTVDSSSGWSKFVRFRCFFSLQKSGSFEKHPAPPTDILARATLLEMDLTPLRTQFVCACEQDLYV